MHWKRFPSNAKQQVRVRTALCTIIAKKKWGCLKIALIVGVSGGRCFEMTREGAKKVREALNIISEQCEATFSCENCPLFDCCHGEVDLFEVRPDNWVCD